MTLTKEQWSHIEENLSGVYGNVKLRCDGYEITASVQQLKPLRSGIVIYVDGYIKGEWIIQKDERCLKFYCARKKFLWSKNKRDEAKKKLLNRRLDKGLREFYRKVAESSVSTFDFCWSSPKAFCCHLRKTCQSIEVVSIGFGIA